MSLMITWESICELLRELSNEKLANDRVHVFPFSQMSLKSE